MNKLVAGGALIAATLAVIAVLRRICRRRRRAEHLQMLRGKVVVITGASSGLGEACARAFYVHGCKLVLCARRMDELKRVKSDLEQLSIPGGAGSVKIVTFDLSDVSSVAGAMRRVHECHGVVDIVINNGGISSRGSVIDTAIDVDMSVINVNYFGQVAVTKALLTDMIHRRSGHIVTVSSIQGKLAVPFRSAYGASKHAVQCFCDSLRAEVAEYGIRVTVVSPGYIQTNLSMNALTADGSAYGKTDRHIAGGMTADYVAGRIVDAVCACDNEVIIGPLLYRLTIYLRNILPDLFFHAMARRAWTELQPTSKML